MAERFLVYYITDRMQFAGDELARRRVLLDKIGEAAHAGVDYIQLREKDFGGRELELLAEEALRRVREEGLVAGGSGTVTRLLINSRTDVVVATGASGVHLRSEDVSPRDVRRVVELAGCRPRGDNFLIGASCHTVDEVLRAESEGADFAVFAPVFEKRDRPEVAATGLGVLREACRARIPVLALGGVTLENAASCLDVGAVGIAGIRLFQENKVEDVVRALRAAFGAG